MLAAARSPWPSPPPNPIALLALFSIQSTPMSTHSGAGDRRPKKKVYYRVPDLDHALDLRKKPALLLLLRSLLASSPSQSLLIRDLEKEVGFVRKWNLFHLIQRHPSVFKVSGGEASRRPVSVCLTPRAQAVSDEEPRVRELMEPILVNNLRKLLMMSMDCRVPLEKIELIQSDMGLPRNFKECLILKYPEFFSIKNADGLEYLCLESWDSSLAVTAREEKLDFGCSSQTKRSKLVSKDGNFDGQFAFKLSFPTGFRPNKNYLMEVIKWQKMAFPSPYLNSRMIEPATPQARKRSVAVLHELLSLMMEKSLTSDKLDVFHREYQLPCRLLLCLVKNHGIFYITNKGARSTVILKETYDGSELIEKCPLLRFYDKFVSLIGRTCTGSRIPIPL